VDLVVVALTATVVRLVLLWGTGPALYWDSETYLGIARYILAHGHPPLLTMRLPGYPVFILLSGGFKLDLASTVFSQHVLGVFTTIFLYLAILTIIRSRPAAVLGALVLTTMPDILFMEATVYSETLATFFVACATWLFVGSVIRDDGHTRWAVVGAAVAFAAWTRPNFALLIPVMGFGVVCSELARARTTMPQTMPVRENARAALRSLGFFSLIPVLIIGGTIAANGLLRGSFRLANGMGFSSLNIVGRPEVYRNLPSDLDWIARVYEEHEDRLSFGYIQWNVVLHPLLEARKLRGLHADDPDRAALDTALRVIEARPAACLKIWSHTLWRYWTDYRVVFGPWRSETAVNKPGSLQVTRSQWTVAVALRSLWEKLQPVLSMLCWLALPFVLLDRGWDERRRLAIITIWLAVILSSVANTAVETAAGQDRYRMPYTVPIVLLSAVTLFSLGRILDHVIPGVPRRWRGARSPSGRAPRAVQQQLNTSRVRGSCHASMPGPHGASQQHNR